MGRISSWNHVYLEGHCFKDKKCHRGYKCLTSHCTNCKYFCGASSYNDDIITFEYAFKSKFVRFLAKIRHWYLTKRGLKSCVIEEEKRLQEELNEKSREDLK